MGGRFGRADHADTDERCRLGGCGRGFPGGALASRGQGARDDRKFMEALHSFEVHNITWRPCRRSLAFGTACGSGFGG
jgi:hypothetical protein